MIAAMLLEPGRLGAAPPATQRISLLIAHGAQIPCAAVRESRSDASTPPLADFDGEDAPEAYLVAWRHPTKRELTISNNPFAQGSGGTRRVSKCRPSPMTREPWLLAPQATQLDSPSSPDRRRPGAVAPRQPADPAGGAPTSRLQKPKIDFPIKNAMTAMPRWSKAKSKLLPEAVGKASLEMESCGEVTSAALAAQKLYILTSVLYFCDGHRSATAPYKRIMHEYISHQGPRTQLRLPERTMFPGDRRAVSRAERRVLAGIAPEPKTS